MGQLKFSIVVPAYNAEKYIGRCLDSLLHQDLPANEYEIIVVNDGSKDGTREILDEYEAKYSNISCFHTENQGAGLARNHGTEQATGEYLLFVDGDDTIMANALKLIYDTVKKDNLDLLVMDYSYFDETGEIRKTFSYSKGCKGDETVLPGSKFMLKCLPPVVWGIAYRMDFLREHALCFKPFQHEDEEFIPRVFFLAERCRFLDINYYQYYRIQGSFVMSYTTQACMSMVKGMESIDQFRKTHVADERMNSFFIDLIARKLLQAFKDSIRNEAPVEFQNEYIRQIKEKKLSLIPERKKVIRLLYLLSPRFLICFYRFKVKGKRR